MHKLTPSYLIAAREIGGHNILTAPQSAQDRLERCRASDKPPEILIIARPSLGDILLATPLIRSIRLRHPGATIDLLVSPGQEHIVEGNTDISNVLTVENHPGFRTLYLLVRRLWRRYDVAIGNSASDRTHLYLWLFGKTRISVTLEDSSAWKRWITHTSFRDEPGTHALLRNNALGEFLGYQSGFKVIPPRVSNGESISPLLSEIKGRNEKYAVLHLASRLPHKYWVRERWCEVVNLLSEKGIRTYLTGSQGDDAYLDEAIRSMPESTVNLAGQLRLAEISELIAGSEIYVGVDTVTSHIAAALGTPTIVLFGPVSPLRWGPWPAHHDADTNPWKKSGSQRCGNVSIVQADTGCNTCRSGRCIRLHDRSTVCSTMLNISSTQVLEEIVNRLSFHYGRRDTAANHRVTHAASTSVTARIVDFAPARPRHIPEDHQII
jgi:heptosyltransferase-3